MNLIQVIQKLESLMSEVNNNKEVIIPIDFGTDGYRSIESIELSTPDINSKKDRNEIWIIPNND